MKHLIKKIFIVISFLYIFTCAKVSATCSLDEKNDLIQTAYNVKIDYGLLPNEGNNKRDFYLTLSNLTKNIEVHYLDSIYSYGSDSSNPSIVKMTEYFSEGEIHEIGIYGSKDSKCGDIFLITQTVKIPTFNSYSERDECKDVSDFKLCDMWYEGDITESQFQSELNAYKKESIKKTEEQEKKEAANKNILEQFVEVYSCNLVISIIITVLSIGVVLLLIIRIIIRSKGRIKIDL